MLILITSIMHAVYHVTTDAGMKWHCYNIMIHTVELLDSIFFFFLDFIQRPLLNFANYISGQTNQDTFFYLFKFPDRLKRGYSFFFFFFISAVFFNVCDVSVGLSEVSALVSWLTSPRPKLIFVSIKTDFYLSKKKCRVSGFKL